MADQLLPKGAAKEVLSVDVGGLVTEIDTNPATSAAAASIVGNDPDAIALNIINLGANNVFIALTPDVSSTKGILIGANGGILSLVLRDDFTLPSREWFGVSPGGASTLYVVRLRRFRKVQQPTGI
jgi:hypothetical protein